uniref:hypothetical protein n=1 Tax=Stutzerimonas nitrititolerans TaxID=2482751 RepID=UPI0028A05A7B
GAPPRFYRTLVTQSVGTINAEAASRSDMKAHTPCVENRFASFPPYEVPSAANEKPPPDGSDGGFFLQLVA